MDVATTNQFYKEIAWLHSSGISTGWARGDGTFEFRPLAPIARDAMAAFLYRAAGSPEFTAPTVSPLPLPADQASEITRLRRELDRTRMERDVLKRAIGIFAEVPR